MTERVFKPRWKPPPDAELNPYGIQHEGIITWRNKRNGFFVGAIHYTADPKKRSQEWFEQATRRFRQDQIEREWEIDFESRAGQRVFGYLAENPDRWRVPNFDLQELGKKGTQGKVPYRIIAAMDYGTTNPTAIHFYAVDDKRRVFVVWEFYKPSSAREIALVLKGTHPDYPHPLWKRCERVVVDTAIYKKDQNEAGGEGLRSVADLIEEYGIYNMEPAIKNRLAGLERIKDMLAPAAWDKEKMPSLYFAHRCEKMWEELLSLVYDELPPHLLLNKNQKEDIVAKNDHAYDALRYALMSIAAPSDQIPAEKPGSGTFGELEREMDLDDARADKPDYL